jgi:protein-S-isoprenylcysteine O-methyltransferase Ste14
MERLEATLFRYRGGVWALLFSAGLLFARYSPTRTLWALPFLGIGQALRLWAAGAIPRYRTETLDAPILVTWGAYAWVRNPLYLGNVLIGAGWGIMANPLLLLPFLLLSLFLLGILIPYEERFLESRFGEAYREYRERVPALLPRRPRRGPAEAPSAGRDSYDLHRALRIEIHSIWVNVLATGLLLLRLLSA